MINVEVIKVHAGQILPCGRVTGNKEFTIGDLTQVLNANSIYLFYLFIYLLINKAQKGITLISHADLTILHN